MLSGEGIKPALAIGDRVSSKQNAVSIIFVARVVLVIMTVSYQTSYLYHIHKNP